MNLDREQVIPSEEAPEPSGLEPGVSGPSASSDLSDEQANELALSVSLSVAQQFPWIGPLIEAALVTPPVLRKPVQVFTRWGGFSPSVNATLADADEEKHKAYASYILQVLEQSYPWLLALLNGSQATLLVFPGTCRYTVVPDPQWERPACAFDIAQLVPLTHLTPFPPEEGDLLH